MQGKVEATVVIVSQVILAQNEGNRKTGKNARARGVEGEPGEFAAGRLAVLYLEVDVVLFCHIL